VCAPQARVAMRATHPRRVCSRTPRVATAPHARKASNARARGATHAPRARCPRCPRGASAPRGRSNVIARSQRTPRTPRGCGLVPRRAWHCLRAWFDCAPLYRKRWCRDLHRPTTTRYVYTNARCKSNTSAIADACIARAVGPLRRGRARWSMCNQGEAWQLARVAIAARALVAETSARKYMWPVRIELATLGL